MRFLHKFSLVQTKIAKQFSSSSYFPQTQLHTHLKPPKANQALKNYLKSNSPIKALLLFRELLRKSFSTVDSYSLLFTIKACTLKASSLEGKQVHALVIKFGFEPIIHLQTSLVNMYSQMGNMAGAHQVFDEMCLRNVVCWTALISGYVDNQKPNKALQLFRQMQMENLEPDQVTVTVALSACADLGALEMGEWIHAYVRRNDELSEYLCLINALISMCAKCGNVGMARK